jgi:hypothetical protein
MMPKKILAVYCDTQRVNILLKAFLNVKESAICSEHCCEELTHSHFLTTVRRPPIQLALVNLSTVERHLLEVQNALHLYDNRWRINIRGKCKSTSVTGLG